MRALRIRHIVYLLVVVSILLTTTSCFRENNPKPIYDPQTIEEVIAQRDYYFTCYMNGELWYTKGERINFYYFKEETHVDFGYLPPMDYDRTGFINIVAYKWPNPNDINEKDYSRQMFQITINDYYCDCEYGNMIDTLPYELSLDSDSTLCISFENGFYTNEFWDPLDVVYVSEQYSYTQFKYVSDFHLWIDSVTTNNNYVLWGRFEGNFANAKGDTLRITKGVYKVKPGVWLN